jgi:hypothetical protein
MTSDAIVMNSAVLKVLMWIIQRSHPMEIFICRYSQVGSATKIPTVPILSEKNKRKKTKLNKFKNRTKKQSY